MLVQPVICLQETQAQEHQEFEASLVYMVTHHLDKGRKEEERRKILGTLNTDDCQNSHCKRELPCLAHGSLGQLWLPLH